MLSFVGLLIITAILSFVSVLILSKLLISQHKKILHAERTKARIGMVNHYNQVQNQNNPWWSVLGRYLGPKNEMAIESIQLKLIRAGFRQPEHIGTFYFVKSLWLLLIAVLSLMLWLNNIITWQLVLFIPLLALLIPEAVLNALGRSRLSRISQSLPDFLDMANVCMNAGLGWMAAIKRVAQELHDIHPDICYEFNFLLEQIQIGVPRVDALRQFAVRNAVQDIEHLVQLLIQNEKLGSPVSEAIQLFSKRIYESREQRMADKAAKASAKMAIIILPFLMLPYFMLLLGEKLVMLGRNW